MSKTFEQGKDEIARLCKYFAANRDSFLAPGIKEAHVRLHLIDPFFECLGWDVRNTAMVAPQYREVVTEDSLEIEGARKAPDYSFRVGTLSKYFGEAKKCGININADPLPAYQLRRYGWSAKVPLSILTDFEEFGVYDCSSRPKPADKAGFGRLNYFHFEEYPDRWRELWDIFSRQAVWDGAFDQYAASRRKRGTTEVDGEFLKEIEGWRDALAHNIALRNRFLAPDDLNSAVQRTIDRLIFLRMAEDRGSESYGQLLKLCEQPDIYRRFIGKLCKSADEKYNSGLFHFQKEEGIAEAPDFISAKLQVDDKVFKPILQSLYFEHGSPYHFGVLPVELLGTVYERFLGKVIRLTPDHRAKVEEKPEVRKAGGVYYTPAYIVDYIVKNTVGKMIEGKSPAQLAKFREGQPLRVLDMACGSGSFLLGAFQCLLDHSLKWYTGNNPDKFKKEVYKTTKDEWRLTIAEKKRLLTTHIFGVDIDPQAVEVSKLSLLLKVMEGETDETVGKTRMLFHERALPNLSLNIKCGNSLIGPDYFSGRLIPDPDELKRVNPFDWNREFPEAMKSGGFDCVIGNPPYLFITEVLKNDREYYQSIFKTINYRFDLYGSFIEKALLQILRTNGTLGFIIPHTLLSNDSFKSLRALLSKNTHIYQIVDLGPGIFQDAKNETMLVFFNKTKPDINHKVEVIQSNSKEFLNHHIISTINQCNWADENGNSWLVRSSQENISILDHFEKQQAKIGDFCTANQGLRTGDNKRYLSNKPKGDIWKPAAGGKEIGRYMPIPKTLFVYYDPKCLDAPRKPEIFNTNEKIVIQEIRNISLARRIVATLDTDKTICLQSTNVINLKKDMKIEILYILGILNSSAVNYYFRCHFPGNNHIPSNQLLRIPIPVPIDKEIQKEFIGLVKAILTLSSQLKNTTSDSLKINISRQIDETDSKIDQLVYELYGLTKQEIRIINKRVSK